MFLLLLQGSLYLSPLGLGIFMVHLTLLLWASTIVSCRAVLFKGQLQAVKEAQETRYLPVPSWASLLPTFIIYCGRCENTEK